jgi:hypothetical protein
VMAAAINGKRRRSGSFRLPSPSSPCSYLSSSSSSCPSLCTRITPLHALEHPFPPKHRRLCISPPPDVVGEVHRRPIFSFPERDRIPHVMLVVQGKPSLGSRSVWSLVPARRSAARAAAIVELHHCRLPFSRELPRRFFTW